jgi:hypothetical protein
MKTPTLCVATGSLCLLAALACGDTVENPESETASASAGSRSTLSETTTDTTTGATLGPTNGTGGTGPGACPPLEPAPSTNCVSPGLTCTYDNCRAPEYRDGHTLSCLQGAWMLTSEELCDQEPPNCPASTSVIGQVCDASLTPGPCSAFDACGALGSAVCSGGIWTLSSSGLGASPPDGSAGAGNGDAAAAPAATGGAPIPLRCPGVPPEVGTSCCPASVPAICDYDSPSTATGGFMPDDMALVTTTGQGGSAGSPGADRPPPCLICSAQMVWQTCGE